MSSTTPRSTPSWMTPEQSVRLQRRRMLKDVAARGVIMAGGFSVIGAILLILVYLVWEVVPLFRPSTMADPVTWSLPVGTDANPDTLYLATEEQNEVGFRLSGSGDAVFFDVKTGKVVNETKLAHAAVAKPTAVAASSASGEIIATGFDDGTVLVTHETYNVTYPDNVKTVTAQVEYPYGETPVKLFDGDAPALAQVAVHADEDGFAVAGRKADGSIALVNFTSKEDMETGESTLAESSRTTFSLPGDVEGFYFNNDASFIFATLRDGYVIAIDTNDPSTKPQRIPLQNARGARDERHITASAMLVGQISLIAGDDKGGLSQFFLVRDEQNEYHLTKIREMKLGKAPVQRIIAEHRRKAFIALDADGEAAFYSATAERRALEAKVAADGNALLAISPRGDNLLVAENNTLGVHAVRNQYPEVSWKSLWGKVWYEGYDEPKYIWQSSAANNDFEPKFSLTPLAFGTFKAAIFAMILAMPLAVCGAIFTAYFMAPSLRKTVKPTIELMAALPTVILGFLAGLWLAPLFESALPGVLLMLLITPIFTLLAAFLWRYVPERIRLHIGTGYEPLLLIPVIALAVIIPFSISGWIETSFFAGDIRVWLTDTLHIPYDQRNSLVVGFVMGIAVIPTVYSIAEDALFEVPKHLTQGSLALGATPWQTLVRVILPTASPGIFSAVMIGFGRAVGETMIVLMATGNTPVMTMNIFEGFRTLSANIAVEMPESEVGSTHFRILFLAALVLFLFTFLFNTTAEIVRQRLRRKYGTL